MSASWSFVSGADLEHAYEYQERLSVLMPECEAVYLWRRQLAAPLNAKHGADEFAQWLNHMMRVPTGEIKNRNLSHFVFLENLAIRSPGLTDDKQRDLADFAANPRTRKWLVQYVKELSQFSPPLYCGEAANLPRRIRDHLSANTNFGQMVRDGNAPAWCELELAFYNLGPERAERDRDAKKRRTLLELIATTFGIAGYVTRRG